MLIYFLFFSIFSLLSISPTTIERNINIVLTFTLLLLLSLFIGFRHNVGGDWDIYMDDLKLNVEFFHLGKLDYVRDFGYELISYICFHLKLGIYGVNFILSIIFVFALHKFAKQFTNNYWIVFVIAMPYIITVIAMGFTRQASAFAFILLSIVSINNRNYLSFFLYSFIALTFHKSAAIFIPIYLFSYFSFNLKNILIFLLLCLFAFILISPEWTRITGGYFSDSSKYVSSGAKYRIILNIVPGFLFLLFYKKLKFNSNIDKMIIILLISNLFLLPLIKDHSTFVDRIIIYFSLIQILVYSRLYLVLPKLKILFNIGFILTYGTLYYIWLNFSFHSHLWVPYQNLFIKY